MFPRKLRSFVFYLFLSSLPNLLKLSTLKDEGDRERRRKKGSSSVLPFRYRHKRNPICRTPEPLVGRQCKVPYTSFLGNTSYTSSYTEVTCTYRLPGSCLVGILKRLSSPATPASTCSLYPPVGTWYEIVGMWLKKLEAPESVCLNFDPFSSITVCLLLDHVTLAEQPFISYDSYH
ncbi:hypothetical protein F5X99DRAFT_363856 [Biscogniauxia marginata]|nr:hypothetical protein F5X99DRAFT_363856 [Biscogniauxia marginata]